MKIKLNAFTMAYTDVGVGAPLLFIHGFPLNRRMWEPQVSELAQVGRVLAPDLRGHGDSPPLPGPYEMDLLAADLNAFLDALSIGEPVVLCGLSMGGYVALEVMRQAPERIERFALLDTTARPDTDEQKRRRRGLLSLADKGQFKGVPPRLLPLLLSKRFLEVEAVTSVVMAMAERVGKEAFKGQQRAIMNRPDSRPLLPGIKVPTLILCGTEDALTPPDRHKEMAEVIPDADLVILGGAGHLAPLERPDAVTRALRAWLRR